MVLTEKNQRVHNFVLTYQREHPQGRPPSLREIARVCGLGKHGGGQGDGAGAAQYHMKKLVEMGMAEDTGDTSCRYRAIDMHAEMVALQRAARNYRPEQIFSLEALHNWAKRAGHTMVGAFAQERAVLGE